MMRTSQLFDSFSGVIPLGERFKHNSRQLRDKLNTRL